jgi:hypothetical protein
MGKFDALFEDEDDIFQGTPESKYWDIHGQTNKDLVKDEFDDIVTRLAVMESLLGEHYEYELLDKMIANYSYTHLDKLDDLKKSVYMELAGKLIFRAGD